MQDNNVEMKKTNKTPPRRERDTVEHQIDRQLRAHGYKNRLSEIIGKWPGDEEFDDLIKMLTR